MSDEIFGGHNFGDPDHSDPRFSMNNMVSTAAQNELASLRNILEERMVQRLCGPKTMAYYRTLRDLADAQRAWGTLPPPPASLDD